MTYEQQQEHAEKLDDEIDQIWNILLSSKSAKTRARCLEILKDLQHVQDCYLSGDGI